MPAVTFQQIAGTALDRLHDHDRGAGGVVESAADKHASPHYGALLIARSIRMLAWAIVVAAVVLQMSPAMDMAVRRAEGEGGGGN